LNDHIAVEGVWTARLQGECGRASGPHLLCHRPFRRSMYACATRWFQRAWCRGRVEKSVRHKLHLSSCGFGLRRLAEVSLHSTAILLACSLGCSFCRAQQMPSAPPLGANEVHASDGQLLRHRARRLPMTADQASARKCLDSFLSVAGTHGCQRLSQLGPGCYLRLHRLPLPRVLARYQSCVRSFQWRLAERCQQPKWKSVTHTTARTSARGSRREPRRSG
jgi:hypothetical protein